MGRGPKISEIDLLRSICKDSFADFLKEFWHVAVPGEKLIWNWHMEFLCKTLQREAGRVFRGEPKKYDIAINVPPGSTKSTICSIMFPAWIWAVFPQGGVICASYAAHLASRLSLKSRDVMISDLYRQCFPGIDIREDQNTKQLFMNNQGGMRIAVGTGGSITGSHGHFLIVDDPIDPQAAVSETELSKVHRWMSDTLSTRKVDKDVALTILIMQRLHEDDPTGHMLQQARSGKRRILHICLPAESTGNVKPRGLRRHYVDGVLDPRRLSKKVLLEIEAELGAYGYAGQFMQNPVPFGGGMIQTEKMVVDVPPRSEYLTKVRYWDKANSSGKGDWTAGVLMARDRDGRFWILDVVRGQWESAMRERIMRQTAAIDGADVLIGIEQEPAGSGKESAQNSVANLAGYRVFVDKPSGDKVVRADPFAVQANNGNVSICRGDWNLDYLNELRFFPHSRHDDQVDATSGAFAKLTVGRKFYGGLPTCHGRTK